MVSATKTPRRKLAERTAAAWRPRKLVDRATWIERNIRLPPETSANPGAYNLRRYPFWRGVIEAVDDPNVEQIDLMIATQLGKTTFLQAILGSDAVLSPAPAMLATPDRDSCSELRDKFYRLCEASPVLARMIPPEHARNDKWIDFGPMLCHLAWSGNRQRLSGKSCRKVLCTEVDRWAQSVREGATQRLVRERVKGFHRFLIINESAPTDDSSAIDAFYEESDQRHYHVPCPHCGHHQELRFFPHREGPYRGNGGVFGLQRESGEWLTPDEVLATAYYQCEQGCRIEEADRLGMISRGVWCPRGQTVNKKGKLVGEPERPPRRSGFQLSSLYADSISFGRFAAEYLTSRENPTALQNWWNNWLALKYSTAAKVPPWKQVGRRLAGHHQRGVAPAGALFLTAGVDTQDDHLYWVVRAWGEGCTSWLVDWGRLTCRLDGDGKRIPASDLDQLDAALLDREFPLVQPNALGHTRLKVLLANVDYQGHRTTEVFMWVRSRAKYGERLRIIAGSHQLPVGEFYRLSVLEKNARTGKVYPGGLARWALDVSSYKADVQGRYQAPLDQPGAWFLTEAVLEDGQDYLRQICNEGLQLTRNSKGQMVRAWVMRDEKIGNHYWDCEIYNRAAADMLTGQNWIDLAKLLAPPPAPPPEEDRAGFVRRPSRVDRPDDEERGGGFVRRRR